MSSSRPAMSGTSTNRPSVEQKCVGAARKLHQYFNVRQASTLEFCAKLGLVCAEVRGRTVRWHDAEAICAECHLGQPARHPPPAARQLLGIVLIDRSGA